MTQLSPEIEALITSVIFLECKMEALMKILQDSGITISEEQIGSEAHRIHATQRDVKRHIMMCRMKDDKFDLR